MNQNNDNEYEIIDSNASPYPANRKNDYSRYPCTNNPNQPLQQTNYKDWLNMCQENQQYGGNPEADTVAVVSAGVIVVGTILTGFSVTTPIGIVLISFGTLGAVLWPGGVTDKTVWEEFMNHGETLFNKEFRGTERDRALQYLVGFQRVLSQYEELFNIWHKNKTADNARAVQNAFGDIDRDFLRELPQLQLKNFEQVLLFAYAEAAQLHLNLLKQGVQFYDEWNRNQSKPPTPLSSSDYYYGQLQTRIKEYTNYCVTTYKTGLNILKNSPNIKWNIYNTYRRDMTLVVLDLVALFPNYDIRTYPTTTISQLTRKIYTDAINFDRSSITSEPDIDTMEYNLTRSTPEFFSSLHELILYTEELSRGNRLVGIRNHKSYIKDPSIRNIRYGRETNKSQSINLLGQQPYKISIVTDIQYITTVIEPVPEYIINQIDFYLNKSSDNVNPKTIKYTAGGNISKNYKTTIFQLPARQKPLTLPTFNNYSHILSNFSLFTYFLPNPNPQPLPTEVYTGALGWTHSSADPYNTIFSHQITQIPVVKGYTKDTSSKVIQGPGHTGGDLVKLEEEIRVLISPENSTINIKQIRIRYASNQNDQMGISIIDSLVFRTFDIEKTFNGNDYTDLKYEHFKYATINVNITNLTALTHELILYSYAWTEQGSIVIVDKIEFIPANNLLQTTNEKQKLEKLKSNVDFLFANHTKKNLKSEIPDYQIDQTAYQIESLSEDIYPQEKIILLDTIKHVKQLSQTRNLLNDGDFSSLMNWTTSNTITVQTGNPTFKGYYLYMSGAVITEINNTVFPTYVYQKIDESKLKPYTQYLVRGFIESSKDLELFVTRYDKEVHTTLNVPDNLPHMNSYEQTNSCEPQPNSFLNETHNTTNQIVQYPSAPYYTPSTSNNSCHCESTMVSSSCQDSHAFSFSIDTGNLDFNENLGIGILFKIYNPDGYATLGNLEVIEKQPLTEEEVNRVKEKENKWRQTRNNQQKETEQAYSQAQQAIDTLFVHSQYQMLKIETTIQDIVGAETFIDKIPYIYNEWLPNESGMNYNMYMELKKQSSHAYT